MVLTTRVPEDPFSDLDKAWISNDYRDFLSANSYLGFSLTTGFLVSGSNINFIAGAPRSNDTGEVVIFEKVRIGSLTVMRQKEILRGQILASSFGYTVEVFDLNGDGFVTFNCNIRRV
ncbi:unnamed protein product [Clavelina lepadiformis]|uniref:Uncharacterized protein n=1 Tax=Clavelina lepadiformis TaxID=159417 RepID=A0ABP0GU29_CLALP